MTSHGCGAVLRRHPSLHAPARKKVGDLFCGAGGASLGFKKAAKKLGLAFDLKAVNHWEAAVKVHAANFPDAQHVNSSIETIDPRDLFPGRRVNLLIAAPECTDHSVAKGGRPVKDQKRASAWHILRWVELLYIDDLLIENVPEFVKWGPCNARGKKIKRLAGTFFNTFIQGLRGAGYNVEWRVLCAADYGDATTRRRLFIIARKRKPIVWPEPTHAEHPTGRLKPWVPALKIIDWSKPGISIFRRHEYGLPPLKNTTLDRIVEGIRRYGPPELQPFLPFLVKFFKTSKINSIKSPLGTVTAGGRHYGLAEPMILPHRTFQNHGVDSIHRPFRTVTGTARDYAVAQPIIVTPGAPPIKGRSAKKPLPTVTCRDRLAVATPVVVQTDHGGSNGKCVRSVDEPAYTITSSGQLALAYPWILPHLGRTKQNKARSVGKPVPTVVAAHGAGHLVQTMLVGTGGNKGAAKARPTSRPMGTITTENRKGVAATFVMDASHGRGKGEKNPHARRVQPLSKPLRTLTTSKSAAVATAFMMEANHGKTKGRARKAHPIDGPMPTLTTKRGMALVAAFIDKYYGTGVPQAKERPLGTITVKPRFGLVEVCIGKTPVFYFDILFRMLEPAELAAAMGFPKGYFVDPSLSKEDIVRMIGNAWPVNLGAALCESILRN